MIRTTLFIPEELHERLMHLARFTRVSFSDLVRYSLDKALAGHLEAMRRPELDKENGSRALARFETLMRDRRRRRLREQG